MNFVQPFHFDINRLIHRMQGELPGENAHKLMWTPYRKMPTHADLEKMNPREAAVLIHIFPKCNEWHIVLIRRSSYEGVHSNQLAFPGGKKDDADDDLWQTALREHQEEVGVSSNELKLIGSLSKVYIPPSNFLVSPFLAYSQHKPNFVADELEVQAILEVPIHTLFSQEAIVKRDVKTTYANLKNVPGFEYNGQFIWGATAIILSELRDLVYSS